MNHRRVLWRSLAAAVMAVSLQGCLWMVAGGAAGAYLWSEGNLVRHYAQPLSTTWEGARFALRGLGLAVEEQKIDQHQGRLTAKQGNGVPVMVTLERWTDRETRVSVRVGALGDRAGSERVHEAIARALR